MKITVHLQRLYSQAMDGRISGAKAEFTVEVIDDQGRAFRSTEPHTLRGMIGAPDQPSNYSITYQLEQKP